MLLLPLNARQGCRPVYKLELYFKPGARYESDLDGIRELVREVEKKWNIPCQEFDISLLSSDEQAGLADDIRSILPQVRGRIVSSRGKALPLSGSKLLNLENTPIVLLRENKRAVDVFPHLLGTTYYDVVSAVEKILALGPSEYFRSRGLLEDPIVKILADAPELIEKGMSFVGSDVELTDGSVDLILRDREGTDVVIEVETRASDQAVGQVLRLARSYASQASRSRVRKAIVCVLFDAGILLACKEAEIELFRVAFERVETS